MQDQKLYFVKKPTLSSANFGREPRIGQMKVVKAKVRKIKEAPADEEMITNEGKLNRLMKSERIRRKAQIGSQQKLEAVAKRARKRAERLKRQVEILPFEEEARKKIKAKTFAEQAETKRKEDQAKAEAQARSLENTAQREAILALPQLLRRQNLNIQALQPTLRQNIEALQRVAPDVAEQLKMVLVPEKEGEVMQKLFEEPKIEEPTEKEAQKSRLQTKISDTVENVLQDESITTSAQAKAKVKELLGVPRMPNGVNEMIDAKFGKKGKGKGLDFGGAPTTTVGEGRKGISGSGLFSSIKNLAKSAVSKAIDVVKDDPIGSAKKAFEVAKQARDQYHKLTGKGGKLPVRHQRTFMKELEKHKTSLGGGLFDQIKDGFTQGFKMPFKLLGLGGSLDTKEEGASFFSSLKDLGKKAISKVAEKVMEDPIGSAKKAIALGQQAREQYAKMTGKKEKGGKMFIPKKHIKALHSYASKAHGKGFADMFIKGLITPFSAVSKLAEHIPVLGKAVGKVGMAIPNVVSNLTGIQPLI